MDMDEYIGERLASIGKAISDYAMRATCDRTAMKIAPTHFEKGQATGRYLETLGTLRWLQGRRAEIMQFEKEYHGTTER